MGAERRNEGGGRSSGAWLRRERREERAASPVSAAAAERSRETKTTKRFVISRLIRTLWGRKQATSIDGIRKLLGELEPNSGLNFSATPNTGIGTRIPEFLIPGSIPCIQTGCKGN
jgi:hypothetical protein